MLEANANSTQNDLKTLGKDANNLFGEAGSAIADKSADIRNKGKAMLDNTLSKAKEVQTTALENSKQIMRNTDAYVQKNPWRAVTISAGVGLLLGVLFKYRN